MQAPRMHFIGVGVRNGAQMEMAAAIPSSHWKLEGPIKGEGMDVRAIVEPGIELTAPTLELSAPLEVEVVSGLGAPALEFIAPWTPFVSEGMEVKELAEPEAYSIAPANEFSTDNSGEILQVFQGPVEVVKTQLKERSQERIQEHKQVAEADFEQEVIVTKPEQVKRPKSLPFKRFQECEMCVRAEEKAAKITCRLEVGLLRVKVDAEFEQSKQVFLELMRGAKNDQHGCPSGHGLKIIKAKGSTTCGSIGCTSGPIQDGSHYFGCRKKGCFSMCAACVRSFGGGYEM